MNASESRLGKDITNSYIASFAHKYSDRSRMRTKEEDRSSFRLVTRLCLRYLHGRGSSGLGKEES
ncbi:hypothetical protein Hanom_Chr06g00554761 [Helianthus anomalus]